MTEFERLLTALFLVAAYMLWVSYLCWKHRAKHLLSQHDNNATALIAWASQTGTAKALAEKLAQEDKRYKGAATLPLTAISPARLTEFSNVLFVVSTYGHGEPPDNGRSFSNALDRIKEGDINLSALRYEVMALGDRKYPHFCAFGEHIHTRLAWLGATADAPLKTLDHSKGEDAAALIQHISKDTVADTYEHFTIVNRRQLNTSERHPLYEIDLLPGKPLHWQAGDILDVQPRNSISEAARSYTIASVNNENNHIKLIVRLAVKEAGEYGLTSGWLIRQRKINTNVKAKLHVNSACHLTLNNKPLLLIAAGSGLAGLRAQWMQAVRLQYSAPIYVFFGERTKNDDVLPLVIPKDVLLADNTFVKRVFSRCPERPMYVQQALQQNRKALYDVVDQGGQIYVCGSYDGMGEGVHHTLVSILGQEQVQLLIDTHRYHRDIY